MEIEIPDTEVNRLMAYAWPGNIRELKNIIERSILLRKDTVIRPSELITMDNANGSESPSDDTDTSDILSLAELEKKHIMEVIARFSGNRTQAAKTLGISRSTLKRKISAYRTP